MEYINLAPNTVEWLQWRKGGIGASDTPSILGCSPYTTAFELWQEKTGRRIREQNEYVLKQGHDVETKVKALYEMDEGEDFPSIMAELEGYEHIRASYDGYNKNLKKAIEVKMVGKDFYDLFVGDGKTEEGHKLKEHFKVQATQQILVGGLDEVTFLLARQPNKAKGVKVDGYKKVVFKRDDALMAQVFKGVNDFWALVLSDTPPAKTAKDRPDETADRVKGLLTKYETASRKEREYKKKADEFKKQIAAKVTSSAICHGFKIEYGMRKGNVDYSKVPELKGVDLEAYRSQPSASLSIKKI